MINKRKPRHSNNQSFGHKRETGATDDQGEGPSPGPSGGPAVSPNMHRLKESRVSLSFRSTLRNDGTVATATRVLERDRSKGKLKKKKTVCGLNKNMWRCKGCCKAFIATC